MDSDKPAHLSKDQFNQGAQQFAQAVEHPLADGDVGAQAYRYGWRWDQGGHPPFTQHLRRSFVLLSASTSGPRQSDEEESLLDSMGLHVDQAQPNMSNGSLMHVHQTIAYSATWKVPVLYVEASLADGSPLSIDALCRSDVFLSNCHNESQHASASPSDTLPGPTAEFPTVGMGENPATGHACVYLHPCHTAAAVAATMQAEQTAFTPRAYFDTFVMLCSTVVEMRT